MVKSLIAYSEKHVHILYNTCLSDSHFPRSLHFFFLVPSILHSFCPIPVYKPVVHSVVRSQVFATMPVILNLCLDLPACLLACLVGEFFIIQIKGPRTNGVTCCTDCKSTSGKLLILGYKA